MTTEFEGAAIDQGLRFGQPAELTQWLENVGWMEFPPYTRDAMPKKGDRVKGYIYAGMSFFLKTQMAPAIINNDTTMIKAKSLTLNTLSNMAAE